MLGWLSGGKFMPVFAAILLASAPTVAPAREKSYPAFDQPVPKGKVSVANPRSLVAALQDAGYKAKLVITDDGDPYISSAADGADFELQLLDCKEHINCQDAMLRSSYEKNEKNPATIETMNTFNFEHRWMRAYLDKDGGPVIEMDLLFTDQLMDEKMFGEAIGIWDDLLGSFHKAIKY